MKHNWSYSTIGVELKTSSGGTPNKMYKEFYEGGNIPWLRSGEVCKKNITETEMFITQKGMDNSSAKWFPENTVLVAMYGATAGQVGILRFPSTTNQAICGIFPNDKFLPEFLYYTLLYSKDTLVSQAVGNAQPNISQIKVKEVSLPKISIAEQQRIVDILDKEFEKIDTLKENAEKGLQQAKDLFQSALKQELQPKEGWSVSTLGEMCDIQGGSTPKRTESLFWKDGTYPWFTVEDIREQGRIITNTKQKITKLAWDSLRVFPRDTILLCCTASLGEYAITKISLTSNQQFNGLVIKDKQLLSPMFLLHYCSTLKDKLLELSGKTTIDFVATGKVKQIEIVYPSIQEQNQIVAHLDKLKAHCKTLQKNYEKTIALCDDMKQALLRKAFNGEF